MSEDRKKERNDETHLAPPLVPKRKKKKKWPILIMVLFILGVLMFLFKKPILKIVGNMPVIGSMLGEQEEELSREELIVKADSQEKEISSLKSQLEALENTNEALKAKNDNLKQYESMYTDFMKQKEDWDEEVAKTDPQLFIAQFEKVYPDIAERIYSTLKGEQVLSNKQKELAATVGTMEEDKVAAAVQQLISTDPELIQLIFNGMSKDRKAAILSEMTSDAAAQVIKLIAPDAALNN